MNYNVVCYFFFFFSSRRRHTRLQGDWSSDVCSSDLRPFFVRRSARSPMPHLGHLMPSGTGCVYLHLGYRVQARNSPSRPVLITIGAPHSLQISSDGRSGTLSFLIDRE